eukprot:SAG22_NODE_900_length_6611_cov_15.344134_2_plen_298_part_00
MNVAVDPRALRQNTPARNVLSPPASCLPLVRQSEPKQDSLSDCIYRYTNSSDIPAVVPAAASYIEDTAVSTWCPGVWLLDNESSRAWTCSVPCARRMNAFQNGCMRTMFQQQHAIASARARMQLAHFLEDVLSLANNGLEGSIHQKNVEAWLDVWRKSYTVSYHSVEAASENVARACQSVHIPAPVNISELYPDLPLYTSVLPMIERAVGFTEPDQLPNCQQRMTSSMPAVCSDVSTITAAESSRWKCSAQCASQLPHALKYCKMSTMHHFLVPVATSFLVRSHRQHSRILSHLCCR